MLTIEQLKERKKYICGSDIAAILGLNPWRTIRDVYLDKINPEVKEREPTIAMECGNTLEDFVLRKIVEENQFSLKISKPKGLTVSKKYPFLAGSIDAIGKIKDALPAFAIRRFGTKQTVILEAKTTSAFKAKEWDAGIPEHIRIQVMHYLLVTGLNVAVVGVLIGNHDFRSYMVPRDEELIERIIEKTKHFWEENVLKRIAPTVFLKKEEPREGEHIMNTFHEINLVNNLRKITNQCEELSKQEKELKKELEKVMGANKIAKFANGETVAQFVSVTRKVLNKEEFEKNDPRAFEVYKNHLIEKHTTNFRVEKPKEKTDES